MNAPSVATANTSSITMLTTVSPLIPSPTSVGSGYRLVGGAADARASSTTSPPALLVSPTAKTPTTTTTSVPADGDSDAEAAAASPRIVYGPGTVARLPAELARLRVSSPLIVSSPSRMPLARRMQALLPHLDSRILDSAIVNVSSRVVDGVLERVAGHDVVVSIGGASAVGLAKAIGQRRNIPHVCIPTTYNGSEMMPLLLDASPARHGVSGSHRRGRGSARRRASGNKSSIRDPSSMPTVVIYDEELTTSVPKRFSAPSDAMVTDILLNASSKADDDTAQWSYIHLPGV